MFGYVYASRKLSFIAIPWLEEVSGGPTFRRHKFVKPGELKALGLILHWSHLLRVRLAKRYASSVGNTQGVR